MTLFYLPGACSLAPHILCRELGLPVELKPMPRNDKSELLKYNPKGHVPTLVLPNGQALTEVAAILPYLADQKPEANLIPRAGTWERYRAHEWLNYVATELHKGFNPLFKFKARMDEATLQLFRDGLHLELQFLDQHFSKNKFLMGETFTVADIYAWVTLSWSQYVKVDVTPHKNVLAFMERVQNRPAVQAAIQAETAQ